MRPLLVFYLFGTMIALACLAYIGCSNKNEPFTPHQEGPPLTRPIETHKQTGSTIHPWGAWVITCIEPQENKPASVEVALLRTGETHLNVTGLLLPPKCTNCLHLEILSVVNQDWTIQATLVNPTIHTAYDVTAYFPGTNCPEILNPDSYTDLFDLDSNSNTHHPFKRFDTGNPNQKWGPGETHAQVFTFRRNPNQKLTSIIYIVGASWPGNQSEVVAINNPSVSGDLYTDGSKPVNFSVSIIDWQNDIEYVRINLEPLNGSPFAYMQPVGGGVYKLHGFVAWGLSAGTKKITITAKSLGSDFFTYNFVNVRIVDPKPPHSFLKLVTGPLALTGPGAPFGEYDVAVVGKTAGLSDTYVHASPTEIYAWNKSYSKSSLLVALVDTTGSNPDFPVEPVSRLAFPVPKNSSAPDTFSFMQTNLDTDIWDKTTNPPVLYKHALQLIDLQNMLSVDFTLTADNLETPELDAILRPADITSGVKPDKYGYALWVPDSGAYPSYYPYVVLVRYVPPYKNESMEFDAIIGGVVEGQGDGKIDKDDVNGVAVWDGEGESKLFIAVSEGGNAKQVELYSADFVSNPSQQFIPIATINGLPGTPQDVAILPVADKGFQDKNWVCILTDSRTIEIYDFSGKFVQSFMNPSALPSAVKHMDSDLVNLRLHVMMAGPKVSVLEYNSE